MNKVAGLTPRYLLESSIVEWPRRGVTTDSKVGPFPMTLSLNPDTPSILVLCPELALGLFAKFGVAL